MRVLVASSDTAATEWLADVLGAAGYTVVVVPDIGPASPELKVADVAIVDRSAGDRIDASEGTPCILMAPRGGTIDIAGVRERFTDVIAVPSDEVDVVERVGAVLRGGSA